MTIRDVVKGKASEYLPIHHPPPRKSHEDDSPSSFSFSTTLRRSSVSEGSAHPLSPTKGVLPHEHHTPFAHTNRTYTPSARFARISAQETAQVLNTSIQHGLASPSVPAIRELSGGPNEFMVAPKESTLRKFIAQFYESPLNLLLLGSAGVSAVVGNFDDAVSISLAIIIVVTVGFIQEQRSEKSLEALNKLVPHYCHLIRDGIQRTELANILVPGDVVHFNVGDRVPADVRLLSASDLEIDESNLTGETKPANKTNEAIVSSGFHDLAISERHNTAFMGTLVKNGRGSGVVVATGDQTEFGVIFSMMQDIQERKTPLQVSMDELAKKLSVGSFAVIGVICIVGVWQKRGWLEMFTIGVSLAVAAIPEGLPIVVTVTLALGVLRMSKRQAIVKKLPSVETLGSVSVICSDKTGTLTTNKLTVTRLYTVDDDVLDVSQHTSTKHGGPRPFETLSVAAQTLLTIGNLCNHAFRNAEHKLVGQSTEVALFSAALALGLADARDRFNKRSEVVFNSEQKWQSVTGTLRAGVASSDREQIFMSGAIEAVMPCCKFYAKADGSAAPLDSALQNIILRKATDLAGALGVRVVSMAIGFADASPPNTASRAFDKAKLPDHLIFAGFQAMLDPPRPGVEAAIASLHSGGVKVVMITGDAEATARSIANQLGIRVSRRSSMSNSGPSLTNNEASSSSGAIVPSTRGGVLTGKEIDMLSQRQLTEVIEGISVFARTTPRHKMAIIEAFQSRGKVVAMTGDGVNDAPALKLADIGISMGKGGTDVAKEAADMILVNDNFATILPAVEEGKSIFYNIQNFLCFQLSTAVAALTLVSLSTALQLPSPLNAMQILFVNILMDGPPSQSLGVDPVNKEVMKKPPRPKNAPVLNNQLLLRILFSASMVVLGTLFIYAYELSDGSMTGRDQTMTFTGFVFLDLVSAIQNRGLSCGITQNRVLLFTCSVSFTVQLLLIYFPPLQTVFQTEALSLRDLAVLLTLAAASATLHEFRRRYEFQISQSQLHWIEDVV